MTRPCDGHNLLYSGARVKRRPTIAIIGPGRVGGAIAVLAARAGWPVSAVGGRNVRRARAAARAVGPRVAAVTPQEAAGLADVVLLTVPDDAIEAVCRQLAAARAFRLGAVVAHCSGALASDVLLSAKSSCGCRIASMHPLQTFPTAAAGVAAIPGTYFFIEGDPRAAAVLSRLARDIGGRAVPLRARAKALYHATGILASNYLVTLMDAAVELGRLAGIDRRKLLRALEPLVRSTVDNVFALGPAKALTGPIARGDVQTVRRHLAAIRRRNPPLAELYAVLGARTVELARRKGTLRPAAAEELNEFLRKADLESFALSTNPRFLAMIERSRARMESEGGISTEEMRRRLGLKPSK